LLGGENEFGRQAKGAGKTGGVGGEGSGFGGGEESVEECVEGVGIDEASEDVALLGWRKELCID